MHWHVSTDLKRMQVERIVPFTTGIPGTFAKNNKASKRTNFNWLKLITDKRYTKEVCMHPVRLRFTDQTRSVRIYWLLAVLSRIGCYMYLLRIIRLLFGKKSFWTEKHS